MMIAEEWYESAERASRRDMIKKPKNLRWCPGIYTDPDTGKKTFCDVWTKHFLSTTKFATFDELFKHVEFMYERRQKAYDKKHGSSSTTSKHRVK